ncbi:glycosyl transferase family 2 [Emticicia oligotrophica DSM 17448]|uniref:Glycosyl transferase family 2 n=1 Tax=Emticicia oligotrophica (strain DSM 17448 / CIP 109782 / MTCC 6937 / GPTSA100-15) TaxID=929562 RepID=A0ABM5MZA7_EMTOG|nr:glycosyltransferase family 2 protein [Emticicia oligotrophica]AFK02517.1 glycosyl transferase family 2 [Emticicia oligotrophica DSM 17448]
MKISIITVAFNSAATIKDTIDSVLAQDYPSIEYIIVDGGSKDGTVEILKSYGDKIKWVSEKDNGIYDAMNKGVKMATGYAIGVMGSDDFYPNNQVISKVAKAFKESKADSVYGDLYYVDFADTNKIVRNWISGSYNRKRFLNGWMPPHTAFFLTKAAYDKYGFYNISYRSAGDYELMLRMLYKHKLSSFYIPEVLMKMRTGGTSNASLKNRIRANKEDRRAWAENGLVPRWYTLYAKPISKLFQWIVK